MLKHGMNRKNNLLIHVALVLSFAGASHATAARITVYTDRTSWENAVGNVFTTENFNAVTPFVLPDGLNNVGLFDIEVVGTANLSFPNAIIDPDVTPNSLNIDGTTFFRGASLPASFPTLVFPNPIIGFGADWTSPATAGMLTLDILGTVIEFDVHAPAGGFLGVVSDTFFTEVAMPTESGPTEGYGMDNVSFAVPGPQDSDNDGIPDDEDACPDSDLAETIVIDGCDSGVENLLFDDGCTMADLIAECAAGASNHGDFVSCVAHLSNEWKHAGLITGQEKAAIQSCAAQSNIPGGLPLLSSHEAAGGGGLCPADINGDGVTNVLDLIDLLLCFGLPATPGCEAEDLNGDGTVNVLDLIDVLLAFGTACQ